MTLKVFSAALGGFAMLVMAGCSSAPDYTEIPVSKLPAGTAPKMPPPPPPNGVASSGTAPHYAETGSANAPAGGAGSAGAAPSMPPPPPMPGR